MAVAANQANDAGALFVGGGIVGGLAAWAWTTTPLTGGFLFGGTCSVVLLFAYDALDCLGNSRLAQITRFALAAIAAISAGSFVVSSLLGIPFTIEAAETLGVAWIVTALIMTKLCR